MKVYQFITQRSRFHRGDLACASKTDHHMTTLDIESGVKFWKIPPPSKIDH